MGIFSCSYRSPCHSINIQRFRFFSLSVMYSCTTDLKALAQNEDAKSQVFYAQLSRITQTFPSCTGHNYCTSVIL